MDTNVATPPLLLRPGSGEKVTEGGGLLSRGVLLQWVPGLFSDALELVDTFGYKENP